MNEVCDRGFCCPSTGSQYHSLNQQSKYALLTFFFYFSIFSINIHCQVNSSFISTNHLSEGNLEDPLFNSEDRPVNLMKSIEKDERCPDGSSWTRR